MKMGRSNFIHIRRKLHINRATSVEINTQKAAVQPNMQRATFARKLAITRKFCRKKLLKVNEMTQDDSSDDMNAYNLDEIGTITTTMKSVNVSAKTTHNKDRHNDKIYARVKLNGSHDIKLKVDTGSDTCTLTSTDLQKSQLAVKIKPSNCILNKYGGGTIKNYGSVRLKISFLNKSTVVDFKIVEAPKNPSILGCRQVLELGLLTLNVNNIQLVRETSQQSKLIEVARQGNETSSTT